MGSTNDAQPVFQVKALGLGPDSNPTCAALHTVLGAIESMRLFLDAFLHACTVDFPDWSVADVLSTIVSSQTVASCHAVNPATTLALPTVSAKLSAPCPKAKNPATTVALPTGSAKLSAPCPKVQKGCVIEAYRVGSTWQTSKEGLPPVSNPICPPPDSKLPAASAPASTPHQAAAEKGKAQCEAKKQKAKQGATAPAVAQQASPQPQSPAADDVCIAAKHIDPAVSGSPGNPSSEGPQLGSAHVPEQVPKESEPASGFLPESAPSEVPRLPRDLGTASPTPLPLLIVSQETSESQSEGSTDQQLSGDLPQYELFPSSSGRRHLYPTSLTPWLQIQLHPDGPDLPKSLNSSPWHAVASGPLSWVMHAAPDMRPVQADVPSIIHRLHDCPVSSQRQTAGDHGVAASSSPLAFPAEEVSLHALVGQHAVMGHSAVVGQHAARGQNVAMGLNAAIRQHAVQQVAPQQACPGLHQAHSLPCYPESAASPSTVACQVQQACHQSSGGLQGKQGHLEHPRCVLQPAMVCHEGDYQALAAPPGHFAPGCFPHSASTLQQQFAHPLTAQQAQPMQVPWAPEGHLSMLPGSREGSFRMSPGCHQGLQQSEACRQHPQTPSGLVYSPQARSYDPRAQQHYLVLPLPMPQVSFC